MTAPTTTASTSGWRSRWRWAIPRRVPFAAGISGSLLVIILFIVATADIIRPIDTYTVDFAAALQSPSLSSPMGTDELGRDIMTRVFHGLRVSLFVSLMASVVALVLGGAIGLAAGALGGKVDSVLMRFLDVFASQNHLLFGIVLAVLFRPALGPMGAILLAVGLTHWTQMARIVRGELLSLRERQFVGAAINGGAGRWRLAWRHYLPHLLPAMGLGFVLLFPHAIFHESALSFLGVGLPPHQASLGNLLADSRSLILVGAWWAALFPGLMLLLTSLAIGTLGEYWRDRHNPRWRSELEL